MSTARPGAPTRPDAGGALDTPDLPAHVQETVEAIARLHDEHAQGAGRTQRLVERLTGWIGRPRFLALLTVGVALWVNGNLLARWVGHQAWDAPPFYWLQGAMGMLAVYVTVLILATQRREDELASAREQLTLELAILSEQKSAKIIALLEELRRDHPQLQDRRDDQAEAMAVPAEPHSVLDAIRDSTEVTQAQRLLAGR